MLIHGIMGKASRMILGSKTDEQLRSAENFIKLIEKNYPEEDITSLKVQLSQKDRDLHKK